MSLWWVVRDTDEGRKFYLQEAGDPLYAALKSALAGFEGKWVESIPLDAKTAKRVKKNSWGVS